MGGGNDKCEETINQMLVEMNGFEDNEGVVITAATNSSHTNSLKPIGSQGHETVDVKKRPKLSRRCSHWSLYYNTFKDKRTTLGNQILLLMEYTVS
jgi:hypothetical protein